MRTSTLDTSPSEKLDPHAATSSTAVYLVSMLFNTLVDVDDSNNVSPGLAEKWRVSKDAKKWSFTLRPGVAFHDGTPLTARDVAWSLRRILEEKTASPFRSRLATSLDADGIDVVDDLHFTLRLKRADSLLVEALGNRSALIVKDQQDEFTVENTVGTGPFQLKSFSPGKSFEVTRNENYFREGRPYLDGIQNSYIDQAALLDAVASGSVDWTDGIPIKTASRLRKDQRFRAAAFGSNARMMRVYFLHMDLTAKPFDDPRVVKAMKLAADRDAIRRAVLGDVDASATTGDVPVPQADPLYPDAVGNRPQDIAQAKQLLADAGYPNGIDVELPTAELLPGMTDLSVAYAETVKDAGIRIAIRRVPADTYFDRVFGTTALFHDLAQRRPAYDIMAAFFQRGGAYNANGFDSDGEVSKRLAATLAETDRQKRDAILSDALNYVADNSGTVIPFFLPDPEVASVAVQGSPFEILGYSWENVWLNR